MKTVNHCDFEHFTDQQVRLLPTGGGGNMIVCARHFQKEVANRREMIRAGVWTKENTPLPKWEDLKVYEG